MTAALRLLHISDIHFGPKHLREASAAIAGLVEAERPELVIVSGDLTQRAKPREFREALRFLEEVERFAPTLSIPGNHDVPLWRAWERLFAPYGAWKRSFGREREPVWRSDRLVAVGIDTSQAFAFTGGRIRGSSFRRAEEALRSATREQFRIVTAHHHLGRLSSTESEHPAWGSRRFSRRLAPEIDLVLSGHLHEALELYPARPLDGFPALHIGTSSSSRGRGPEAGKCSLQWIEVGEREFTVQGRVWGPGSARFEPYFERRYPRRER